jgi:hypothetical protein
MACSGTASLLFFYFITINLYLKLRSKKSDNGSSSYCWWWYNNGYEGTSPHCLPQMNSYGLRLLTNSKYLRLCTQGSVSLNSYTSYVACNILCWKQKYGNQCNFLSFLNYIFVSKLHHLSVLRMFYIFIQLRTLFKNRLLLL